MVNLCKAFFHHHLIAKKLLFKLWCSVIDLDSAEVMHPLERVQIGVRRGRKERSVPTQKAIIQADLDQLQL